MLFQVPRNGVTNSYAADVASGSLSHTARREIRPPKMHCNRRVEPHQWTHPSLADSVRREIKPNTNRLLDPVDLDQTIPRRPADSAQFRGIDTRREFNQDRGILAAALQCECSQDR